MTSKRRLNNCNPVHGHYVGMGMELIYRAGTRRAMPRFGGENPAGSRTTAIERARGRGKRALADPHQIRGRPGFRSRGPIERRILLSEFGTGLPTSLRFPGRW